MATLEHTDRAEHDLRRAMAALEHAYERARAQDYRPGREMQALHRAEQEYEQVRSRRRRRLGLPQREDDARSHGPADPPSDAPLRAT